MRDVQTPLRQAIFKIITDLGYTVYENGSVPDKAKTPYIIILEMNGGEASNKSDFGHSILTLLDVVTSFDKDDLAGSKLVDSIAGDILGDINSKTILDLGPGLQMLDTKLVQDQKLNSTTNNQRIYRRLMRYKQLIMEV